jgi:D-amino-acid dehydrogenase
MTARMACGWRVATRVRGGGVHASSKRAAARRRDGKGTAMARVAVIGAGVVGLACVFHLRADGHEVMVIDPAPDGDKCSWGNAGAIAVTEVVPAAVPGMFWRVPGWLLDPLGPLALRPAHLPRMLPWLRALARASRPRQVERIAAALASLLDRVYADVCPMLEALSLSGDLHRAGALTVYRSLAALRADREEWALKRRHGIACEDISGEAARALEPALGPGIAAGVVTPAWSHVSDPKTIWAALLADARRHGVAVRAGTAADLRAPGRLRLRDGVELPCDAVVVAAGAWSASLARQAGDLVLLESERGYNVTVPTPGVALSREVIFAEQKFVATPLSIGLRIGGAAEFAGLDAKPNYARSRALAQLGASYLPGLSLEGGTAWMGQRPATPDSLPVLGASPRRKDVFYAFGHGHLGLTLAATSGRLIADQLAGRAAPLDLAPFSAARFT